jgi:hypothetical protein
MVKTAGMGFQVHAVVQWSTKPTDAQMATVTDHFEHVEHEHGSKVITITEHVSVNDEADAIGFVRALLLDAAPKGSTITSISATSD